MAGVTVATSAPLSERTNENLLRVLAIFDRYRRETIVDLHRDEFVAEAQKRGLL